MFCVNIFISFLIFSIIICYFHRFYNRYIYNIYLRLSYIEREEDSLWRIKVMFLTKPMCVLVDVIHK